jgi:ribosome-binding ATPase YchF (GTP1/OBG family)
MNQIANSEQSLTPVDDVRLVREELDKECGGDLRKLAARANKTAEEYRQKLGLKIVQPPARGGRRDGTGG